MADRAIGWLSAALALTPGVLAPTLAHAAEVYSGCDAPPAAHGRTLHANPTNFRNVLSSAAPGDLILLDSGSYGAVTLNGKNDRFITIAAAPNQTPLLSGLNLQGSHWVVSGLTITGYTPPKLYHPNGWQVHEPLVSVGRGDNFILHGNTIASTTGEYAWRKETQGEPSDNALSDGIRTNQPSCVSISDNKVFNIFNGITVAGDQQGENGKRYVVDHNVIHDFAGDGIDHSVSDALIHANNISINHDICDQLCIHSDGIQGWNYADHPGLLNSNVTIDGNFILQPKVSTAPLFNKTLQGITIFNGNWHNLRVTNNVVVVTAWHGISVYGADGEVANNTVAGTSDHVTWLMVNDQDAGHGGSIAKNMVVRNNLAPLVRIAVKDTASNRNISVDHNIETENSPRYFVAFDPSHSKYDMHLKSGSPAIAKGAHIDDVSTDADGHNRASRSDVGAYSYTDR